MSTHPTRLRAREAVAQGTTAFHLDRPAGFDFLPGQAIDVVLPVPPDGDPASTMHTFSIVSAPFENEIVVATRMRDSAFKRSLGAWPIGASLEIGDAGGSLTLHPDRARPAVFIAGGIGITPFMSMLRQAAYVGLRQRLVLLYSNRRPEDAAFLDELQALEKRHPDFRLVATMTQISRSSRTWDGPTGPIDETLLRQVAADLDRPVYYVVGPPAMAEAMRMTLGDIGLHDDDIRGEEFYGY